MNIFLSRFGYLFSKHSQFARFVITGIINTLFGYSLFALFIFINLHYTLAVLLATCIGIVFNFYTIGTFVFLNNSRKLMLQFFAVYVIIYFVTLFLIKLINMLGVNNLYLAGAIASLITPFISFYLNKNYVFVKPSPARLSADLFMQHSLADNYPEEYE